MTRPEILTHPQIPPPLHGLAPRTVKGKKWWDQQRQIAYAKHDFHCHACGVPKSQARYRKILEAHESYKIDWAVGRVELEEIVALCHSCHNFIHRGLMEVLVEIGKMPKHKMSEILRHGDRILQEANLRKQPIPDVWAPWAEWVLVIDGVEFPGRFESEQEWLSYFEWLNRIGRKDTDQTLEAFRDGKH